MPPADAFTVAPGMPKHVPGKAWGLRYLPRERHTQANKDEQHGHTIRSLFASVLPVPCDPMDYRASKATERARPRASVLSHDIHNPANLGPSRCNVYGMDSSRSHLDVEPVSSKYWTSNTSFGGSGLPSAAACDDEAPVASAGKAWPAEDAPAAGA